MVRILHGHVISVYVEIVIKMFIILCNRNKTDRNQRERVRVYTYTNVKKIESADYIWGILSILPIVLTKETRRAAPRIVIQ